MIVLEESIHVQKDLSPVFKYTSDFGNIQDWDPGVIASKKKTAGTVGVGSVYDLTLKFGPFRPGMQYVITEYTPNVRVVLKGKGDAFSATDTISFIQTGDGTRIDYQAKIEFSGFADHLEIFLRPILKKTGEDAIKGKLVRGRQPCRSGSDNCCCLSTHV